MSYSALLSLLLFPCRFPTQIVFETEEQAAITIAAMRQVPHQFYQTCAEGPQRSGIPDLVRIRTKVPKMVRNRSGIGHQVRIWFWNTPVEKKGGLEVRKGGLKVREGRMEARKGQKAVRKRGRGVKTTRKEKRLLLPPKRVTTIHLQSISSEGVNNLCPLFVLGRKTLLC